VTSTTSSIVAGLGGWQVTGAAARGCSAGSGARLHPAASAAAITKR